MGGSKSTGAKGLKKVKNFKRSKSAPAGFGVLEEDEGESPQKKIKINIKSDLDEKKKKRKGKKPGPKKGSKRRWSKKHGIYGGHYYDFSFLDSGDSGGDGGGGE